MTQDILSITIGIAVNDVQAAVQWYKTLLGNVETIEPAPGTIELRLSKNTWLQLDDTGDLSVGGSIVRLETQDIDAVHQKVRNFMSDVGDIQMVEGVIRYFDFKDIAGNRLSYYQLI